MQRIMQIARHTLIRAFPFGVACPEIGTAIQGRPCRKLVPYSGTKCGTFIAFWAFETALSFLGLILFRVKTSHKRGSLTPTHNATI
jgi:hypothetical protein